MPMIAMTALARRARRDVERGSPSRIAAGVGRRRTDRRDPRLAPRRAGHAVRLPARRRRSTGTTTPPRRSPPVRWRCSSIIELGGVGRRAADSSSTTPVARSDRSSSLVYERSEPRRSTTVGITGTNGKTTTAQLLGRRSSRRTAGRPGSSARCTARARRRRRRSCSRCSRRSATTGCGGGGAGGVVARARAAPGRRHRVRRRRVHQPRPRPPRPARFDRGVLPGQGAAVRSRRSHRSRSSTSTTPYGRCSPT